ncbi:MAG: hypothetical protein AB7V56_13430 [Candidatus Nitrosocosmicus sp.]|jgi:hypothetical protein|uniref:hypothetical protein n=1 Tax=Candidatus Nitrosocosmicus agrestis TaxID=2563600 RepID=UPI00122DD125|nr:hypothetical protein [Candidatus Nitrosocosmicus sp. SS]KAA2283515.1 hypothetical protein F1Z66_01125 [Candidatus Nitrosocosmicus sp. SS]KAF0869596.1 hypothetical protein E5N71_03660 [Candidatus Nitrosocosmicus sp. SS]MDR4490286.1 hypothetical protein [Candidatus Nitrosocosmicus sp.]
MISLFDNGKLIKYYLNRNDILISSNPGFEIDLSGGRTHQTALDIFPNSLFNKKVRLSDESFVGFAMETTDKKIIVFGDYEQRYDIPKSKADEDDNSISLDMEWNEFATYRVNDV